MKKLYFLFLASLLALNANSQASFCEDFELYSNGTPIAETSKNWNTWGELMPPYAIAPFIDDANVVNTQSSSGSNSLYLNDAKKHEAIHQVIYLTKFIVPCLVFFHPSHS